MVALWTYERLGHCEDWGPPKTKADTDDLVGVRLLSIFFFVKRELAMRRLVNSTQWLKLQNTSPCYLHAKISKCVLWATTCFAVQVKSLTGAKVCSVWADTPRPPEKKADGCQIPFVSFSVWILEGFFWFVFCWFYFFEGGCTSSALV